MSLRWTISNAPSPGSASIRVVNTTDCTQVSPAAVAQLSIENVAALNATAGQTVLASWFNSLSGDARRKLCFAGRIASKEVSEMLPTITYEWTQPKARSKTSFKEFRAMVRSGAIVFQSHQAGRFSATYSPGFIVKKGYTPKSGRLDHHFGAKYGYKREAHSCRSVNFYSGFVSAQRPNWNAELVGVFTNLSQTLEVSRSGIVPWIEFNEIALRQKSHDIYNAAISGLKVEDALVTSLRSQANSGSFDLLTEIAEFPETVKWLYSLIKEIISLFRKTKRQTSFLRKNGAAKDVGDKITSLWMQYRYAVTPLVHSVVDGLSLLEHEIVKYQSFRQGYTERKTITLNGVDIDFDVVHRCVIKHRYGLEGQRLSDVLKSNILSTAWERVPLSFVVDWAFNIGDLLSALQLPSNVSQENSCYSWRINTTLKLDCEYNGIITVPIDFYKRIPIDPLTHLGLNFSPVLNTKRSLDAMSLAWQMFIRKKL